MPIIEVQRNYEHIGIYARKPTAGLELDMVNSFISYRKSVFKEKSEKQLMIFVEPKINNAYPDIIFTEYNPFAFENWVKSRNNLNISDLKILNYILRRRLVTSEDIVKELSIKYKSLLLSLEKLYDSQLIDRSNSKWTIISDDFIGVKKIESIEAKISKWKEVFQQALLNKNFSSESSVLSKLKGNPLNDICNAFSDFGLGIYVFNDYEFSRITKPKQNKVPVNYISLFVNEWVGRILNN